MREMAISWFFRGMSGLGLLAALAGCCANSVCDCQDERVDALTVQFRVADTLAGGTGFRRADVDTVYVLRYAPGDTGRARHDSVALLRLPSQATAPFLINNGAPFGRVSGRKLNGFDYEVFAKLARSGPGPRPAQRYRLSNIELRDELAGNGCCSCFRNSRKTVVVTNKNLPSGTIRSTTYDLTEQDDRQPRPLVLTRH